VAAADHLRSHSEAPKIVIGHSLGGAAVLAAAGRIPEAVAVATIGAPADPGHVQHLFQAARPEIEAKGEAEVLLAGRPFTIKKQFLEDIEATRLEEAIAGLRKALLVFHAPRDMRRSGSKTPGGSSPPRSTRRASFRSTMPITC
jgi:putative redox protein